MTFRNLTIKTLGAIGLVIFAIQAGLAQKSAVTNTHFALQEAKNALVKEDFEEAAKQLASAREYIDGAISNEKTMVEDKTWLYRGDVYAEMLRLPAENSAGVTKIEAAKIAAESYKKTIELDVSKRKDNATQALNRMNNVVYVLTFNEGIQMINSGDNKGAMEAFEVAMFINEKDTNAALNAAIASERMEDFDKAFTLYKKMVDEMGATDHFAYIAVANNYMNKEDYDNALKYIQKGIEVNENAKKEKVKDLLTTEFNIYLKSGRLDEAIANVKKGIETDPENDGLYTRLGQLYDQMRDKSDVDNDYAAMAIENYQKALEINPNNLDANYNLGAFYYNKAASIYQEVNNMDLKTYQSKGAALEKQGEELFNKAIPYFKKAHEMAPDDPGLNNSLKTIYTRLKNYEEAAKYK